MNMLFNAAIIIENEMFFSAKNYNGLFKMNVDTGAIEFLCHFPEDPLWKIHMHQNVINGKENIYFFPLFANSISKYNTKSGEIKNISLYNNFGDVGITCVLVYKGKYILVPRNLSQPIVRFSAENDSLSYLPLNRQKASTQDAFSDINCSVILADNLYIPIYDSKTVLQLNLVTEECIELELSGTKISTLTYFDNKFWTISSDGKCVCKYSDKFELIKTMALDSQSDRPYQCWMVDKDSLYLCGCFEGQLLRYIGNEEWENILSENLVSMNDNFALMCGYQVLNDSLYIFPSSMDSVLKIDQNVVSKIRIDYSDAELVESIRKEKYRFFFGEPNSKIVYEGQEVSLIDLIGYLENS